MDKFLEKLLGFLEMSMPVGLFLVGCFSVYNFYSDHFSGSPSIAMTIYVAVLIEVVVFIILRIRQKKQNNDVYKLEKWIEYDQKRKEIEEQMNRLYAELTNSDMTRYVDLNRLIFSGQPSNGETKTDYSDAFLQQFGIDRNSIKVKENSAVFLTPFNAEGHMLYRKCQQVLGDMGILLRRSDNYVEKDNILANIIYLIVQSEFIVANIDGRNPNVYYELGIAHAIGKPTILISKSKGALEDVGFDLRQKRIILYETERDLDNKLMYQISMLKSSNNG